tara:strand:- start:511 stop:2253 length:1743 start_codon:yes stop_codon:yes gene_type:complete
MGVVEGSIHWNGQNNFFDFIQFAAEKAGMTREEYIATYGFPHKTESVEIEENKKKPGPDPYHRGLDDEEVDDKEDQIKKQAKMDDDDPDAYKEMPGDKEAREKGEVKTSKATKAYSKLYGEDLDEGVMGDLHQMANEIGDEDKFVKAFFKEYGDKIKKSKDSEDWVRSLYKDTIQESFVSEVNHTGSEASDKMAFSQLERIIDYATMIRDRMAAGKGLDAWMYGKVIKAEDYLNTLYDVIDGDDGVVETQKMNKKDWKKIKPFNKHITKDGEKFVMSYDDRIGTFLEPVEIVDEAFKLGKKNQYSIDDVNVAYGFWGTLETSGFKSREIEDCMHSAMAWLTENYRFSDAGALYYLNAKAGRWIADQVIEQRGRKDVVDVLEDYATDVEWKKWSKEYNKYAQEEMMSEAKRGDIHRAAKKGSYPATVVVISSGMVVKQELVKTPAVVPAVFNELQKEYPNSVISVESKTGEILFSESVVTEADDEEQKSTDRGPLDDDKIETALKKKAKDTGVPIGIIRAVMRRGLAAWKSGHRPGANQQQWGYARVNAFLTKGEGTWGKADKDLAKEVRDGGHDKNLKKA